MEWQIRERGTDKVLEEFESDRYEITGFGSVRAYYKRDHNHAIDVDFDFGKHYICRKGEILVSESEYNALKAELAELKENTVEFNVIGGHEHLNTEKIIKGRISEPEKEAELEAIQKATYARAMAEGEAELSATKARLGINYNEPVEPEEATRGDEIVARIQSMIDLTATLYSVHSFSFTEQQNIRLEIGRTRDELATIINQGV